MIHFHLLADAFWFFGLEVLFVLIAWAYCKITAGLPADSLYQKVRPLVVTLTVVESVSVYVSFLVYSYDILPSVEAFSFWTAFFALCISLLFLIATAFNPQCRQQIARPFQSRAAKLIFAAIALLATIFGAAISAVFKGMIYLLAAGAGAGAGSSSSGGFFNEEKSYKNGYDWDEYDPYLDIDNPLSADWD